MLNSLSPPTPTLYSSSSRSSAQAICFAAIFEFLGALLLGSHVTRTIRKGIADVSAESPSLFSCIVYI